MFREGAYEDEELLERVVAQIAEERQKLDEQHALDDLSQLIDAGDELVQKIETSEEDEDALATDVEPWISQVLGTRLESVGDADTHSMQVSWAREHFFRIFLGFRTRTGAGISVGRGDVDSRFKGGAYNPNCFDPVRY